MRIFQSLLILIGAAILFLIPVSEGVKDFRTDPRTDTFTVTTTVGVTTANVTLQKAIYDDDTSSITLYSPTATDAPLFSSYNSTSRQLVMTGFTDNATRSLQVSYLIYTLNGFAAINTLFGYLNVLWILGSVGFIGVALYAILRR